ARPLFIGHRHVDAVPIDSIRPSRKAWGLKRGSPGPCGRSAAVEWSRSTVSPRSLRTPVSPPRRGPAPLALGIYGGFTVITLSVAWALGRSPVTAEAWLPGPELVRHAASIAAGLLIAAITVRATRTLVKRWSWVRALHADLRPSIHDA